MDKIEYLKNRWINYYRLNSKPNYKCSIDELIKKDMDCKYLIISCFISSIICYLYIMNEFIYDNLHIMAILIFMVLLIIGYDQGRRRENIQFYIYIKKNDIIKGIYNGKLSEGSNTIYTE